MPVPCQEPYKYMAPSSLGPEIKISHVAVILPHAPTSPRRQPLFQLMPQLQPRWPSAVCLNTLHSAPSWKLCICSSFSPRLSSHLALTLQSLRQIAVSKRSFLGPFYVPLHHPAHLLCITCHYFNYRVICVLGYLMPVFLIPPGAPW